MRIRLIVWEKENGFKGKDVAKAIGVSESTWSKIKMGKQEPTHAQIERLRSAYNLDNVLDLLKEG